MEIPVDFSYLKMNTEKQKQNTSNTNKIMSDDSFAALFVEAELKSMGVNIDTKCKSAAKNKKKNKKSKQESFEELLEKQMAAMSENCNPVLNSGSIDLNPKQQEKTTKQKRKQKEKEKNDKVCDIIEKSRDENLANNDVTMVGYDDLVTENKDGKRLYNTPDGNQYPSVTSVLSIINEDKIAAWRKRVGEEEANRVGHRASSRGTSVHSILERYLLNEDTSEFLPHVKQSLQNLRPIRLASSSPTLLRHAAILSSLIMLNTLVTLGY
jgi:hypothetical protein